MTNGFDIASYQYDISFTFSKIGKAQRSMVFKYLDPIITQNKTLSVLELNCGTGEDAIHFSGLGHNVIATDISEGMISVAKAKTYSKNLTFKTQDIRTIDFTTFNQKFDFIFSNFGGFNCLSLPELKNFFKTANHLLTTNGKIVLVIMPKHCLWERFYFSLKGNSKKARRRQTNDSVIANVDGVSVSTWYYNPKDIEAITKSNYCTNKIKPIGFSIPPSYLENSLFINKISVSIFKLIDRIFTNSRFAKYSDHFLIELTKTK